MPSECSIGENSGDNCHRAAIDRRQPCAQGISCRRCDAERTNARASGHVGREFVIGIENLIVFLVIGLIAGWLAGQIMKGGGYGIVGDLIVGIIGAVIGGWLWGALRLPGIGPWWLTDIIVATIGACILLFLLRLIKR
jgi:uncharacterized membrane protein YeaQ/YmgE (transglycosylase-associated protein family)